MTISGASLRESRISQYVDIMYTTMITVNKITAASIIQPKSVVIIVCMVIPCSVIAPSQSGFSDNHRFIRSVYSVSSLLLLMMPASGTIISCL